MIRLPWADSSMAMPARSRKVSIKGSASVLARLNLILGRVLPLIYEYNNSIRHTGYYLKPVHIATRRLQDGTTVKYYYYGRYWYKVERDALGKLKWVYLGKEKPSPFLPNPPPNPLEGVVVKKYDNSVEVEFANEEVFREVYKLLYP